MAQLMLPDRYPEKVEPANGVSFTLEEMHKIIGGYIEVVNMGHDRYVVVDEEGLLKELPYNHMASILVHGIVRGPIVGPALVCTYRELEGEYEDAEDEDNEDEKNT